MSRNTVENVIRKFGSQQRVAELLGIWQTAVSGWVRRGAIPARRQEELLEIARREGLDLAPSDFFVEPVLSMAAAGGGRATSHYIEPRHATPLGHPTPQGLRTAMTATAEVIELKQPAVNRTATKDLYEIGEIPPVGHVPANMYAWAIRKDRHGEPISAMQQEVVPVAEVGDDECLVMVMAAGVNYNGVWAALGIPLSPLDVHKQPYHIAGSDASGIVYAVGSKVKRWKVGDEVVIHCNQDDGDDEECNGGDPMNSPSQRIWGYETTDGSFAQFCKVQSRQLMPRPKHLTWEEAGCYTLVLATAYRMLFGHPPHTLKPGDNVLVWGGAGGLGSMATQLIAASRRQRDRGDLGGGQARLRHVAGCQGCHQPQAVRLLGRDAGPHGHGQLQQVAGRRAQVRQGDLGRHRQGQRRRHRVRAPGRPTFPVSALVCKRGGMVVICAGTTGYKLTVDARYLWMRQKTLQGSHFANLKQASAANRFVLNRQVDPCMSEVFAWSDIPRAHMKMWKNQHKPGNMAVLVQAKRPGMRTLEEAMEG